MTPSGGGGGGEAGRTEQPGLLTRLNVAHYFLATDKDSLEMAMQSSNL